MVLMQQALADKELSQETHFSPSRRRALSSFFAKRHKGVQSVVQATPTKVSEPEWVIARIAKSSK
jgi:hypothetical protein